ncbi:hypothetical protein [Ornithinibacillus sp. JPR2-1]|uniref:hypothetical protein n=1 Tax=Ornithinibacillus sp. JPR2-1 TaxID=2094019 RepID=UPI0031DDDB03
MDGVKYEVQFGCVDGREGAYKGNTKEAIHRQIDQDTVLRSDEKDILKYGYFQEFKGKDYKTSNYVIDNGIHFIWKVNKGEGKISKIIKKVKELLR